MSCSEPCCSVASKAEQAQQRALGMFINTLPLRVRLRDVNARELVERTQRELVELLSHEQASLAAAQRCSGIAGSAPLFTALAQLSPRRARCRRGLVARRRCGTDRRWRPDELSADVLGG